MKISRTGLLAALGAATMFAAAARTASAASFFGPGVNDITFHNYESIFDSNGVRVAPGTTIVQGDYIVGMLQVDEITPLGYGGDSYNGGPSQQLTAVFAEEVVAPPQVAGTPANGSTVLTLGVSDRTTFSLTLGGTTINTGLAGNTMFQFYSTNSNPFNAAFNTTTDPSALADSFATATAGSKVFSLGFNDPTPGTIGGAGDNGYFYDVIQTSTLPGGAVNTTITAYGGLNFLTNTTGASIISGASIDTKSPLTTNFGTDLYLESTVTPNTTPTPPASPWDFYSHDPAVTSVVVPVPASVWTGLSMLGILGGVAAIRRRKALQA